MNKTDDYLLARGAEGSERLFIQHELIKDKSIELLQKAGLAPGMNVFEAACGTGLMTALIAKAVGPKGSVTATDISEQQLELAKQHCADQQLENVTFELSNVMEHQNEWADTFDMVYGRLIFCHLTQPQAALKNLVSYLKPGGVLVCEESIHRTSFCEPYSEALDRTILMLKELQSKLGLVSQGNLIYSHFKQLGLSDIYVALHQPLLLTPTQKQLFPMVLREASPKLIEQGVSNQEEIDRLAKELDELCKQDVFMGYSRMTQIFGRRPNNL